MSSSPIAPVPAPTPLAPTPLAPPVAPGATTEEGLQRRLTSRQLDLSAPDGPAQLFEAGERTIRRRWESALVKLHRLLHPQARQT